MMVVAMKTVSRGSVRKYMPTWGGGCLFLRIQYMSRRNEVREREGLSQRVVKTELKKNENEGCPVC